MTELAPCVVTHWPALTETEGREETYPSWDVLFQGFTDAPAFRGPAHPGWTPARFEPLRRAASHVRAVYALTLDYDRPTEERALDERLGAFYAFVHSTRSSAPGRFRWRAILPLSRPVSAFEYSLLWTRIAPNMGEIDQAPKDPSRFWFAPGVTDPALYRWKRYKGKPINVDEWLAKPDPTTSTIPPPQSNRITGTDIERRAIAYLDKMPEAISGAGGHQITWRAALVLCRGFDLDGDTAVALLAHHYNPRCDPPWSEKELRHKVDGALRDARVPVGFLLQENSNYTRNFRLPDPPANQQSSETPTSEETQPRPSAVQRYGVKSERMLFEALYERLKQPRQVHGLPCGHSEIDRALGGFRRGNVTVFGAKRGFGKSSYGNLVIRLAPSNARILLVATEDSEDMYAKRFLAARAGILALRLRDHQLEPEDYRKAVAAIERASSRPFFVRSEGRTVEWIGALIQEVNADLDLDLVVVDYLQKIRAGARTQDRRNEVTYVTSTLTEAIKSCDASGLLFSQLKRSGQHSREEPDVEDLKESGDIEDMADHILLGWKPRVEQGDAVRRLVKIGKNKDGEEPGEVPPIVLPWDSRTASFLGGEA